MNRTSSKLFLTATFLLFLALTIAIPSLPSNRARAADTVYSLADQFSVAPATPVIGPWSYGYTATLGGPLQLFALKPVSNGSTGCPAVEKWYHNLAFHTPVITHNPTPNAISCSMNSPPNIVSLHPGPNAEQAVARFTAPAAGTYQVDAVSPTGDSGVTDVHIFKHNDVLNELASGPGQGNPGTSFQGQVALLANETLNFAVGYHGDGFSSDNTFLSLTITQPRSGPNDDGDGYVNSVDKCPQLAHPSQAYTDGDRLGDDCDPTPNPPTSAPTATNTPGPPTPTGTPVPPTPTSTPITSCVPPPANMLSWFRGQSNTQNSVPGDNLGPNASFNGTYMPAGKVGHAFRFDGVDDYLSVPDNNDWNFTSAITLDMWVYFGSIDQAMGQRGIPLFNQIHKAGTPSQESERLFTLWDIPQDDLGYRLYYMTRGPGVNFTDVSSAPFTPVLKQWYHIALVHPHVEGQNGPWSIYINGQIAGSTLGGGYSGPQVIGPMTEPLEFGRQFYFNLSTYLDGGMDEIGIFNRALSPQEILMLYNAGSFGKCLSAKSRLLPRRP